MKIDATRLTSLYDQYSNQENRLTHALLHTIGSSHKIFVKFLKDFTGIRYVLGRDTYEISTQKVPLSHVDKDPDKVDSVPDAWIVEPNNKIGIIIEVKDVSNYVKRGQLSSHLRRLSNYQHQYLVVITPDLKEPEIISSLQGSCQNRQNVIWRSWDDFYRWLFKLKNGYSSNSKEGFLIRSMLTYLQKRRSVLWFQGIFFTSEFNVYEAKDILNAEMEALQGTIRRLYRNLVIRRPVITTMHLRSVWDCFGVEDGVTNDIHITFSIHEEYHDIGIIVPNAAKPCWTRLRKIFSDDEREEELLNTLKNLRKGAPKLFLEFSHRHFITRRKAKWDAHLVFNIDTKGPPFIKKKSKTKEFPVWYEAIKTAISKKRRVNGQLRFGVRFYFDETPNIGSPEFIKTARDTLKELKPLYSFLTKA